MPAHRFRTAAVPSTMLAVVVSSVVLGAALPGCSSKIVDTAPATAPVATPVVSPPTTTVPAGQVRRIDVRPGGVLFDAATSSLVILSADRSALQVLPRTGAAREVTLPAPGSAVTGDGDGRAYVATRGGVVVADLAAATATRTAVTGQDDTEFTAIGRRADGRLVLGSDTGTAYTLAADLTVSRAADGFARVDAIVTVGDIAVVFDAAQTSLTALTAQGSEAQALRAGLGATAITADPAGRVLVADTRGGQLLVYSVNPLIQRQAYPVGDSPFGIAGSSTLVWVSQTATNTVVGYDLSTGIPVEKVRHPTVQQPDWLAFDEATDTLYVVSGAGAGVQEIADAGVRR